MGNAILAIFGPKNDDDDDDYDCDDDASWAPPRVASFLPHAEDRSQAAASHRLSSGSLVTTIYMFMYVFLYMFVYMFMYTYILHVYVCV